MAFGGITKPCRCYCWYTGILSEPTRWRPISYYCRHGKALMDKVTSQKITFYGFIVCIVWRKVHANVCYLCANGDDEMFGQFWVIKAEVAFLHASCQPSVLLNGFLSLSLLLLPRTLLLGSAGDKHVIQGIVISICLSHELQTQQADTGAQPFRIWPNALMQNLVLKAVAKYLCFHMAKWNEPDKTKQLQPLKNLAWKQENMHLKSV